MSGCMRAARSVLYGATSSISPNQIDFGDELCSAATIGNEASAFDALPSHDSEATKQAPNAMAAKNVVARYRACGPNGAAAKRESELSNWDPKNFKRAIIIIFHTFLNSDLSVGAEKINGSEGQ